MKIVARFDPTESGSTSKQTKLVLPFSSGNLRLFVINPTSVNIDLYFSNGDVAHAPAHCRRFFQEDVPSGVVFWQIVSYDGSYSTATPPVTIEMYEPYEAIPVIYSDVQPAPNPFGQVEFVDWIGGSGTQTPTITIPNVAGQIAVLDGFDVTIAPGSGTGAADQVIIVGASVTGIDFQYAVVKGSNAPLIDHVTFPNKGLPQATNTAITLSINSHDIGTGGNGMVLAKYHYEINY